MVSGQRRSRFDSDDRENAGAVEETGHVLRLLRGEVNTMFEWIEEYMERFDCDWDTAAREYHAQFHPETYDPEDYDD